MADRDRPKSEQAPAPVPVREARAPLPIREPRRDGKPSASSRDLVRPTGLKALASRFGSLSKMFGDKSEERDPTLAFRKFEAEKVKTKEYQLVEKSIASIGYSESLVDRQNELIREIIEALRGTKGDQQPRPRVRRRLSRALRRALRGGSRYGNRSRERLRRMQEARRTRRAERIGKQAAEVVKGVRRAGSKVATRVSEATQAVRQAITPKSAAQRAPIEPTVDRVPAKVPTQPDATRAPPVVSPPPEASRVGRIPSGGGLEYDVRTGRFHDTQTNKMVSNAAAAERGASRPTTEQITRETQTLERAKTSTTTPQAPEVARVPPVPATPTVPQAPATPTVPQAPATPTVPQAPEVARVQPAPATPTVQPAPEVARVQPAPATPTVPQAPEVARVPPAPATPTVQPAPEVARVQPAPEVARVPQAPEVARVQPAPEVARVQPAPEVARVQPAPEVARVPQAPPLPSERIAGPTTSASAIETGRRVAAGSGVAAAIGAGTGALTTAAGGGNVSQAATSGAALAVSVNLADNVISEAVSRSARPRLAAIGSRGIPVIGSGLALYSALQRYRQGDATGALMDLGTVAIDVGRVVAAGAGTATAVTGVGAAAGAAAATAATAAQWSLIGAGIIRDVYNEVYTGLYGVAPYNDTPENRAQRSTRILEVATEFVTNHMQQREEVADTYKKEVESRIRNIENLRSRSGRAGNQRVRTTIEREISTASERLISYINENRSSLDQQLINRARQVIGLEPEQTEQERASESTVAQDAVSPALAGQAPVEPSAAVINEQDPTAQIAAPESRPTDAVQEAVTERAGDVANQTVPESGQTAAPLTTEVTRASPTSLAAAPIQTTAQVTAAQENSKEPAATPVIETAATPEPAKSSAELVTRVSNIDYTQTKEDVDQALLTTAARRNEPKSDTRSPTDYVQALLRLISDTEFNSIKIESDEIKFDGKIDLGQFVVNKGKAQPQSTAAAPSVDATPAYSLPSIAASSLSASGGGSNSTSAQPVSGGQSSAPSVTGNQSTETPAASGSEQAAASTGYTSSAGSQAATPVQQPTATASNQQTGGRMQTGQVSAASGSSGDQPIMEMIKRHEGKRNAPYRDSLGLWTVGYGHLIGDGRSLPPAWNRTFSDAEIDNLFAQDYAKHKAAAERIPGYEKANETARGAIIDLTFNMGNAWFRKFPAASAALARGDFNTMANEMQNSLWYRQVGTRGPRIVAMLRAGASSGGRGATPVASAQPGVGAPLQQAGTEMAAADQAQMRGAGQMIAASSQPTPPQTSQTPVPVQQPVGRIGEVPLNRRLEKQVA